MYRVTLSNAERTATVTFACYGLYIEDSGSIVACDSPDGYVAWDTHWRKQGTMIEMEPVEDSWMREYRSPNLPADRDA